MTQTMRLVKRSLCACGFDLVHPEVPMGKEYQADMGRIEEGILVCGGCGGRIPVTAVWCLADGEYAHCAGFVPLEALEPVGVAS